MSMNKSEYIELYGAEAWEEESKRRRSGRNHEKDAAYEEARKGKRNEYFKQRREYHKEYYQKNKERKLEYAKSEARKQYRRDYYEKNKERYLDKDYAKIKRERWYSTQSGRASYLRGKYQYDDKTKGFDTSNNITTQWIVDNIFTQKCIYCGDTDWRHLGADRIDNSKPHTPDNVVCACGICNKERRNNYSMEDFIRYRELHPRDFDIHNLQVIEKVNGKVVIRKRAV